jgi:DNA-binding response OmpR family regulator
LSPGAPAGQRILLVLNESELTALVLRILDRGGMKGEVAHTGEHASRSLAGGGYDALFLSVVLPDMMGYEFIERVRALPIGGGLPILLLSTLFHPTRYKRSPTSLYGADDYIEMHHLPDFLVPKLAGIIGGGRGAPVQRPGPRRAPPTREEREESRQIEVLAPEVREDPSEDRPAAARRMARIIVGDIALYNEETIRGRPASQALEALKRDLEDGKRLMAERFPELGNEAEKALTDELFRFLARHAATRAGDGGSHGR